MLFKIIKIIIEIKTIYYLYRVSGSYSIKNHRGRGWPPQEKNNSNYNNILFLAEPKDWCRLSGLNSSI